MSLVDSYITIGQFLLRNYVSSLARYRDAGEKSATYPAEITTIRNNIKILVESGHLDFLSILLEEMLGTLAGYYNPNRPDKQQLEQEFLHCIEPVPGNFLEKFQHELQVIKKEFGTMSEYWDPEQGVWIRFDKFKEVIGTLLDPESIEEGLKDATTRIYIGLRPYWNLDHVMQAVFHFNDLYAEYVKKSQDPTNEAKQANKPFKRVAREIMDNVKKLLALKRKYGPLGWIFKTGYDARQAKSIVLEINQKVLELEDLLQKALRPQSGAV